MEFIIRKTIQEGSCSVFPIGAITKGQKGEELAELGMMYDAGCVAFSDDGRPVMDSLVMRRALEYSKIRKTLIISHAEDMHLAAGGVMNEGLLSLTLGLKGIPVQAEEIMIARDIALAELTGGRLHIAHVSTAGSVELLRAAKKRGIAEITAETCPHYFSITEEAVRGYNANAFISHNLAVVYHVSDAIGVLYLGRLVEVADTRALFRTPLHPYTRMLLDAIPDLALSGRQRTPGPAVSPRIHSHRMALRGAYQAMRFSRMRAALPLRLRR